METVLRRTAPNLRALIRLAALVLITAALYVAYRIRPSRMIIRLWSRAASRILGLHAAFFGPRPAGSFLLVANHLSYVDALLLMLATDAVLVAKSEVRAWPVIGHLASSMGTLFIDRRSLRDAVRVAAQVQEAIAGGTSVAFFPEATSSDGSTVLPFKAALLEFAARDGLPVHHAAIDYDRSAVAWFGEMDFLPHFLALLKLPSIDASIRFGGSVVARDRKELAQRLWDGVTRSRRMSTSRVT